MKPRKRMTPKQRVLRRLPQAFAKKSLAYKLWFISAGGLDRSGLTFTPEQAWNDAARRLQEKL